MRREVTPIHRLQIASFGVCLNSSAEGSSAASVVDIRECRIALLVLFTVTMASNFILLLLWPIEPSKSLFVVAAAT